MSPIQLLHCTGTGILMLPGRFSFTCAHCLTSMFDLPRLCGHLQSHDACISLCAVLHTARFPVYNTVNIRQRMTMLSTRCTMSSFSDPARHCHFRRRCSLTSVHVHRRIALISPSRLLCTTFRVMRLGRTSPSFDDASVRELDPTANFFSLFTVRMPYLMRSYAGLEHAHTANA